jgi:hypothetical protein
MMIIVIKDGEIINVASPLPINNPEEGLQADGTYILYVNDLEGLEPYQFIDQRYWDGTSLQTRSPRPSPFCIWTGSSWIVDEINYLKQVRFERDMLLYRCDWTQLHDAPITVEQDEEVTIYRQALRDMTDPIVANPQAYMNIEDAPWPTPPEWLNVS